MIIEYIIGWRSDAITESSFVEYKGDDTLQDAEGALNVVSRPEVIREELDELEVRVELVGGDALGDDVDEHIQLVIGSHLSVVFYTGHVEDL
jgi:hypothetical protein